MRCVHVYYNYHYYYSWHNDDNEPEDFHYGIIVDIDYANWDGIDTEYEILYIIYCVDGVKRFFSEDEVFKVS